MISVTIVVVLAVLTFIVIGLAATLHKQREFLKKMKDVEIVKLFQDDEKLSVSQVSLRIKERYISWFLLEERLSQMVAKGRLLAIYETKDVKGSKFRQKLFFLPPKVEFGVMLPETA